MKKNNRFFQYLKPQKVQIIVTLLFCFLYVVSHLIQPILIGKALDNALVSDFTAFLIILIACFSLSLLGAISDFFFEYKVGQITQKTIRDIRKDIYHKINTVSVETLFKESDGNLVQLEIGDVENVANGMFSVLKSFVEGILSILVTILMMFLVNWILALGVLLLSPLSLFVSRFVAKFNHKYFKRQAQIQSELNRISLEAINNIDLLQTLDNQENSINQFENQGKVLRKEGKIAQFSASWTNPTTRLVNNTIYAVIGVVGIVMISFTPTYPILMMSVGSLSSFLTYTAQFSKPFNEISSVMSEFETALFSFQRIDAFLAKDDDIDEGKEDIQDISEITFEHMSFSYEKDKELIIDFNETVKRGEKVAIVGPTGAGKSTLINVLIRFNGVDGVSIAKKNLRKNFGMVLQETWIFSGTIMENVRYAKADASDEEVIDACKRAHADTFIQTLPDGYQTKVTAKAGLSEGERQMITIARVMLLEPDIVILDEATSNVDTRTEKLITDAFDQLLQGKTSIVIAHRLSTIKNADLILVLKDGHIIEQGNHTSLLAKRGFYYSMYSSQFQ